MPLRVADLRETFRGFAAALLLAVLGGCSIVPGLRLSVADPPPPDYRLVTLDAEAIRAQETERPPSAGDGLPAIQPGMPPQEYVIGPGDILLIVVWDHPELTNPIGEFRDAASSGRLVAADGTIFYPHVGTVAVAGKTVRQVRDLLAERLAKVIQSPRIDVRVVGFRAQRIQVTGEVRQPGVVTLDDTPKGLLEAINERGGLGERASRRQATLVRSGRAYSMDLSALLSGSRPAANPALLPGDIVHVPDQSVDQVFVLGEVGKPAPVYIQHAQMSLTEALSLSGGLDRLTADDAGVLVFRQAPAQVADRRPTIFSLDLSRPEGLLLAGQFELRPRDVVYVQATDFAEYNLIISQLLPTISAIFQLDLLINRTR